MGCQDALFLLFYKLRLNLPPSTEHKERRGKSRKTVNDDETEIHIKPFCPEPVLLYNAAVQFCTIHNCTIQYTLHYSTVQYSTHYNAVLHVLSPNRTLCLSLQPRKGGIVSVYPDTELISIHKEPKKCNGAPLILETSPGLSAF